MNQVALIIVGLSVIWALGGVIVAIGLRSLYAVEWVPQCATLNIAIRLILLQIVTRSEKGNKQIYEGEREEDQLNFGIVMLIAARAGMIMLGLLWWLLGQFMSAP